MTPSSVQTMDPDAAQFPYTSNPLNYILHKNPAPFTIDIFALPMIYLPFLTDIKLSLVSESLNRSIIKLAWVLNSCLLIILSFILLYSFLNARYFLSKFNLNFLNLLWVNSRQHPQNTKNVEIMHPAIVAITLDVYYLFFSHYLRHSILLLQSCWHLESGPFWNCVYSNLAEVMPNKSMIRIKMEFFI